MQSITRSTSGEFGLNIIENVTRILPRLLILLLFYDSFICYRSALRKNSKQPCASFCIVVVKYVINECILFSWCWSRKSQTDWCVFHQKILLSGSVMPHWDLKWDNERIQTYVFSRVQLSWPKITHPRGNDSVPHRVQVESVPWLNMQHSRVPSLKRHAKLAWTCHLLWPQRSRGCALHASSHPTFPLRTLKLGQCKKFSTFH